MQEWNYPKNNALGIFPEDITEGSSRRVWWICSKCGHEWQTRVNHRSEGQKCLICAKKENGERIKQYKKEFKYTKEHIEALKKYYPIGDWEHIFEYFPNSNKASIKSFANKHGIFVNKKVLLSEKDITGMKFNKLTAISIDHKKDRFVYWKCKCDCGNKTIVDIYSLLKGTTKSCGCILHNPARNSKDYTGMKFGMLTALERLPHYKGKRTYYRCACECGKTNVIVDAGNLHSGHTVSCGTHNHKKKEYWICKHPNEDEDKRNFIVYRHIAPNGKSYIGITKQNAERRFQNGNGYKSQPVFWRAINKYKWENFEHEVLEKNLTEKEACEKEDYYIKKVFNSLAPKGYNNAEGGSTGFRLVKPIIQYYNNKPVNFFESITEAENCLKIFSATMKSHNTQYKAVAGYYFDFLPSIRPYDIPLEYYDMVDKKHYNLKNIVKEEQSKTTINRNISLAKPINKYEINGKYICTYRNIGEVKIGLKRNKVEGVYAAVNPKREGEKAYGYMWRYDDGSHSNIEPFKYKHKKIVLQIDPNTNEIVNEFNSISKAARTLHCSSNYISDVCNGIRDNCKGYKWRFK